MPVYGSHKVIEAAFTRPADTTQYAVNDAVSDSTSAPTVMTFSDTGRTNIGSGLLRSALLIDSANQGTAGDFRLFLFDAAPTAMEDNAAFDPTDAELANVVAVINFTTDVDGNATAGAGGNAIYASGALDEPYYSASGNLFGILTAQSTYTPVSAEIFTVRLKVSQD